MLVHLNFVPHVLADIIDTNYDRGEVEDPLKISVVLITSLLMMIPANSTSSLAKLNFSGEKTIPPMLLWYTHLLTSNTPLAGNPAPGEGREVDTG